MTTMGVRLAPRLLVAAALTALAACDQSEPSRAAPATVSNPQQETELTTITLTAAAEQRLGITIARVERRIVRQFRTLGGEIIAPPGRSVLVSAPLAGTLAVPPGGRVPLAGERVAGGTPIFRLVILPGDRDLARAQEDVDLAGTRARLAASRAERARELRLRDLMSAQDEEDARGAAAEADATLRAAVQRMRTLGASGDSGASTLLVSAPVAGLMRQVLAVPGQTIPAGAALFEIVGLDTAWVRVPVYAGEIGTVDRGARAAVRDLSGPSGRTRQARPVIGPPTADLEQASVDLYYALEHGAWRPGQRVAVDVPLNGTASRLVIPWSAVVFDALGGAWVYQRTARHSYARRRIELAWVNGDMAVLSRGLEPGTDVVIIGAAELFGTEFGVGK